MVNCSNARGGSSSTAHGVPPAPEPPTAIAPATVNDTTSITWTIRNIWINRESLNIDPHIPRIRRFDHEEGRGKQFQLCMDDQEGLIRINFIRIPKPSDYSRQQ